MDCASTLTQKFYQQNNGQLVWSSHGYIRSRADTVIDVLSKSFQDGLNPNDYHLQSIWQLRRQLRGIVPYYSQSHMQDLSQFDILLTDAVLRYATDLARGRLRPDLIYPQWKIRRRNLDVLVLFTDYVTHDDLPMFLLSVTPTYPGYLKLREKLALYQQIANNGGWVSIPAGNAMESGSQGDRVWLLQQRLLVTGELEEVDDDEHGIFNL